MIHVSEQLVKREVQSVSAQNSPPLSCIMCLCVCVFSAHHLCPSRNKKYPDGDGKGEIPVEMSKTHSHLVKFVTAGKHIISLILLN